MATSTDVAPVPCGVAVGGGHGATPIDREARGVVDEVVVRGREGRKIGGRLLVAPLREGGAAVERKPGEAQQDHQSECEQDQDLTVLACRCLVPPGHRRPPLDHKAVIRR